MEMIGDLAAFAKRRKDMGFVDGTVYGFTILKNINHSLQHVSRRVPSPSSTIYWILLGAAE